ncbi:S8 family peptidase [Cohnella thailandensis]|uniref:S8 family peptidase n=1 Tax=Cohnella thailandensis TaxID=557557 RepID=A0A841SP46_9BACL|nr:S8 family peptidase [Cohnella thailandensis]MBB6632962.1 S8 family peptidase [Cohnella thailandensis]MBP1975344.1 subtilisin family serine protease [Cohnella thailandensis]
MDMSGLLEWLKGSLSSSENRARRILRFLQPEEERRFLHELRAQRKHSQSLQAVRRLGIIRAYTCSLPSFELPKAFSNSIVWEDDVQVSTHALPQATRARPATDKGIPWGIRRVRAPEAWGLTTGYKVKVGVIDTGVDFQHPDLRHSVERGINLLQRMLPPNDDNGHGTHIAGTIAAANQLQGMIGVSPRASIYPVKAFDYNGTAYVSDIILGIDWCVRNRMDVVNMSFGMRTRSKALLNAVTNAYRSGVLIVASSGNDGKRGEIDYPARYLGTVAVGATDRDGRIAEFTNRSSRIDVYAPGEKIDSCWLRGVRRNMSGTSMATSHVTGAVALLLAHRPGLTPAQVKRLLRRSTRPLRHTRSPRPNGELDIMRLLRNADKLKD